MQPSQGSISRPYGAHRRSPGAVEPGPPPNIPVGSISPGFQGRSSASSRAGSSGGGGSRRVNREISSSSTSIPLSQIEKSVTHLLVATKQLLETLTQWSRGQATDTQVSDVYVRLGYEFNMACRAFSAINVDTTDLGNVPDSLRHILEATLSQEATSENLERYLPRIRDIIVGLLHGLKRKQQKLRQKQNRDREQNPLPERTTSVSTVGSGNSGLTNLLNEGIENGGFPNEAPQRGDSLLKTPKPALSPTRRYNSQRDQSRTSAGSEQSSLSSNTMQNIPVMPPYPSEESQMPSTPSQDFNAGSFPPPPPPPPDKTSSALAALQKGGDLERRASRRYSQYQISRHLGSAANGMPILPSQNGPAPNRGRGKEARESLRAVQKRESVRHSRTAPSTPKILESPPIRTPSKVMEEATPISESPQEETPRERFAPRANLSGPPPDHPVFAPEDSKELPPRPDEIGIGRKAEKPTQLPLGDSKANESYFQVSPPPTPTHDLTLFLQYKSKIKKFVLPEGREELSIGRLQLAFIDKFAWNTHQNGADLPEIYIQDPVSGVRHELEDLADVKDRTVLVLNVEPLDEVKRHIDDGMLALTKIVREVKQNVDDHGAALQQVADRQNETARDLAKLAIAPPAPPASFNGSKVSMGPGGRLNAGQLGELQSLRRDLAVLRQTYSGFQSEIQSSMSTIRQKASNVKTVMAKAMTANLDADLGWTYINNGRKQLNNDSDRLVGKVDDLQDLVEDLRKDVVHRGVRPLPRQLEGVSKEIATLTKDLNKMEEYIGKEKPVWTKVWETMLEEVCQGRDELRLMEELVADLRSDLENASSTFSLVEEATKEQNKDSGTGASAGTARQFSRGLGSLGNSVDQSAAKEGVLDEVRALMPNHEGRLEAIERAEKLRQKELANRRDNELHREIEAFVAEGKFRKTGGFEELERMRLAKEDRIRKEVWERMNGLIGEDEEYEEEEEEGEGEEGEDEGEEGNQGEENHEAESLDGGVVAEQDEVIDETFMDAPTHRA